MINIFGESFVGRRERNEDSIYYEYFSKPKGNMIAVLAVADGIGGQGGGPEASRIGVNTLKNAIKNVNELNEKDAVDFIKEVYFDAHSKIIEKSKQAPVFKGMGSTLVCALIFEEKIIIANLGDSRAYQIIDNSCIQITKDHTVFQDSIDRGVASIEEIEQNPMMLQMAGALMKSLGDEHKTPDPDIFILDNTFPQTILLCSDGLSGSLLKPILSQEEIKRQVLGSKNLEFACKNLISKAYQSGSTDNISLIIFSSEKLPKENPVPKEPSPEKLLKKEKKLQKFVYFKKKILPLYALLLFVLFLSLSILTYNMYQQYLLKKVITEKSFTNKNQKPSPLKKAEKPKADDNVKISFTNKKEFKKGEILQWSIEPQISGIDFEINLSEDCKKYNPVFKTKEKSIKIDEIIKESIWTDGAIFCLKIETETKENKKFSSPILEIKVIGK